LRAQMADGDGKTAVRVVGTLRDIHELKSADNLRATVFAISEAAHTCTQLDDLYRRIHHSIEQLLPAKNLFFALHDPTTDVLSFPYHVDEFDAPPPPRKMGDKGLTQRVIRSGSAVLMTPEMRAQRIAGGEQIVGSICMDWLGVPLANGGEVIGAMVIQSYTGEVRYNERDKELLHFVSDQVAAAIVRKQTFDRMARLALHDPLTLLPNRVLWQERLQQAILESKRDTTQFALLYLDLDLFKPVNDNFGHAVGDRLLVQVAERLQLCIRGSDTLARLGGDEFTVLLRQIKSTDDAAAVMDKIAVAIKAPFELLGHTIQISVTQGAAFYPADGYSADQLMKAADQSLYRRNAMR
jgi:diguanylate cyclase (GGDEF)-like protein